MKKKMPLMFEIQPPVPFPEDDEGLKTRTSTERETSIPSSLASENETQSVPLVTIPKWYKRAARKIWREQKIKNLIDEYTTGIKGFKPETTDVIEYEKELRHIKPKDLNTITQAYPLNKHGYGIVDAVKNLDRKYASLVHILMDNNTIDTIIVNEKGRTFDRKECKYILSNKAGKQYRHKKLKMNVYFYFQNNPFPVFFDKNKLPEGMVDATLLKKTMHFEFLQALANAIKMKKQLDILVLVGVLAFILNVIILIVCLKGFHFIGK